MTDVNIQLGYKDSAWFTSEATRVLLQGQIVFLEQTNTYKLGDGVTDLQTLSFLGAQDLQSVTDNGNVTTNDINVNELFLYDLPNGDYGKISLYDRKYSFYDTFNIELFAFDESSVYFKNAVNGFFSRILLNSLSGNRQLEVPDKNGTIATITDVTDAIVQTITNGDTTHAPSSDVVFDALALKVDSNTAITGATKTKITYDAKGLVTSGADATTADIADSTNKRYVTDANLTVIGNTSGTNTGDETASTIATINHGTSAKTTLVDADEITGQDSANSFSLIRVTALNVYNYIKAKTDAVYLKLSGGALTGLLQLAKSTNIASASTTDLSTANGNLVHITGSTTITSLGTAQAGTRIDVVFDAAPLITHNATSLILNGSNIQASAGDTAVFVSEGSGNWRMLNYVSVNEAYTNYTPTVTGFSVNPTFSAGTSRYKLISKNTCHVIVYPDALGTSNATTFTITLPFTSFNGGTNGQVAVIIVQNNSAYSYGTLRTRVNSNIADIYLFGFAAFTASGNKACFIDFTYQIEI